jgi:hypothetical protein
MGVPPHLQINSSKLLMKILHIGDFLDFKVSFVVYKHNALNQLLNFGDSSNIAAACGGGAISRAGRPWEGGREA